MALRLLLGSALLLLHLVLLQGLALPLPTALHTKPPPQVFSTRSVALTPVPTPPVAVVAAAAKPKRPLRQRAAPPQAENSPTTTTTVADAAGPTQIHGADGEARGTEPEADLVPGQPDTEPAPDTDTDTDTDTAPATDAPVAAANQSTAPLDPLPTLAIPDSVQLFYDVEGEVKRLRYQARSELHWQHDGESYDLRFTLRVFLLGARVQTSRGRLSERGLEPLRFSDASRNERAAHFDYATGRVTFSVNSPDAELLAGAQDRLSVFIQLGAMLAGEPSAFAPGSYITKQTVGPRTADLWRVQVIGEEVIRVRGDATPTLKLAYLPEHDFEARVELWYAPTLGYLPVRIRLTQANADFVDMQLRSLQTP